MLRALFTTIGTLFYFRLRVRSVYGLTEVVVGIGMACSKLCPFGLQESVANSIGNRSFLVPMLTASIYLIVRGLDNVHQGLVQKPPDPVAAAIVGKLNCGTGSSTENSEEFSLQPSPSHFKISALCVDALHR
jgi:hypothetical protein